jgi:hypothetical protein
VKGFLVVFELGCKQMGLDDTAMKASLAGKLQGAAAAWLQGLEDRLRYITYTDLKASLLAHFGGEVTAHVRTLQRLKQRGANLAEHNIRFSCEAAAAAGMMSPLWAKELYLASLASTKVREHLQAFLHLDLQRLQTKALDLDMLFGGPKGEPSKDDRSGPRNHQDP